MRCKGNNFDQILPAALEVALRVFELKNWVLQAMLHSFYLQAKLFFSSILVIFKILHF